MRTVVAVLFFSSLAAAASPAPPPEVEHLLPLPSQRPAPDLGLFLKDTSLCIFPFVKESAAPTDTAYLEAVQKTFYDVARQSPLLESVKLLPAASHCDPHDGSCIAAAAVGPRCQHVLVGSSAAKGNGFVLSVRIFQVAKQAVVPGSEVEQVLETDRESDVEAWAQGQACRALQVHCEGRLQVDADRRDMNIYIDNRPVKRTYASPETFVVMPGVHEVRVSVGQRTSLAKKVAVRRDQTAELVSERQTEKGGLPLWTAAELNGQRPETSSDVHEGSWTRPIGYTAAGVGIAALGVGLFEGLHAKSLRNDAQSHYAANGNTYLASDISTLHSARNAASVGNVLTVAGAALAVAGGVLVFAF